MPERVDYSRSPGRCTGAHAVVPCGTLLPQARALKSMGTPVQIDHIDIEPRDLVEAGIDSVGVIRDPVAAASQ
jgi:hypothetical protein